MKIEDLAVRKIFDSRGNPTIEVLLKNEDGLSFGAQVPSGASTGEREAVVFEYEKAKAVASGVVKHQLFQNAYGSIQEIDNALLHIDESFQKEEIGGNLCLGISIAAVRALAFEKKKPIWEVIREEFFSKETEDNYPLLFSNLINGGAHAQNNLDIQEYMVVVEPHDYLPASIGELIEFYRLLEGTLKKKFSLETLPVGDEGGFVLNFSNNVQPLEILQKIKGEKFQNFFFALDAAASQFEKDGSYDFERKALSPEKLLDTYMKYFEKIKPLVSIEDPFAEHDESSFKKITKRAKKRLIVGDDLTVTNAQLIKDCLQDKLINSVIIKPNQIGTVSETCKAIHAARAYEAKIIVSHRSGETDDHFIIHLARAANADGVKIGAPARERLGKYNELLRVYDI